MSSNPKCPGTIIKFKDQLPLVEVAATLFRSKWWTAAAFRKAATRLSLFMWDNGQLDDFFSGCSRFERRTLASGRHQFREAKAKRCAPCAAFEDRASFRKAILKGRADPMAA